MIVTLTPNPSLDRTVTLPGALVRGGVNRLSTVTIERRPGSRRGGGDGHHGAARRRP